MEMGLWLARDSVREDWNWKLGDLPKHNGTATVCMSICVCVCVCVCVCSARGKEMGKQENTK